MLWSIDFITNTFFEPQSGIDLQIGFAQTMVVWILTVQKVLNFHGMILILILLFQSSIISFSSFEQPKRIPNFCNDIFVCLLFEYFYLVHPKMPTSFFVLKNENTLRYLKLGKLKFMIGKIGCSMSWWEDVSNFVWIMTIVQKFFVDSYCQEIYLFSVLTHWFFSKIISLHNKEQTQHNLRLYFSSVCHIF